MNALRASLTAILLVLLTACAGVIPKTADQSLYAAYSSYIAVENTATDLLGMKIITVDEAKAIQVQLNEYRPILESARVIIGQGKKLPNELAERLRMAQKALFALQMRLQAKRAN